MGIGSLFNFKSISNNSFELPSIYNLEVEFKPFVKNDLISIYSKILTDCVDRTQGIKETWEHALWDNCLASEGRKGLITLLAEAMSCMEDLFLVWKQDVLRVATTDEADKIKKDYEAKATSSLGVFISFKNYRRSEILQIYSGMEYAVLNSLHKTMNLSKSLQFKMDKMRDSVGLVDSSVVIDQAKAMASALACGKDIMMDGEDSIETAVPDLESTKSAISFLDAKRSFVLNLPLSYITGEQTPGIGSTGEADVKAVERGLKSYWISIIKPTVAALFNSKVTFKSQDFRLITVALDAIRTFDLVSNNLISLEAKRLLASQLLNVPNDMEGEPDESEADNVDTSGPDQNTEETGTQKPGEKAGNPRFNGQ